MPVQRKGKITPTMYLDEADGGYGGSVVSTSSLVGDLPLGDRPSINVTPTVIGGGSIGPTVSISGGSPFVIIGENGEQDAVYVDAQLYDKVNVIIEYSRPSANYVLYLYANTPITKNNLVGEGGYFNIRVQYLKRSSVQYAGDEATYTGYAVMKTDTFTLDEWINYSTGKTYDGTENVNSWVDDANHPQQTGYHISFGTGNTCNGFLSIGKHTVTIRFYAHVNNGYEKIENSFDIMAYAAWYNPSVENGVELRPYKVTKDLNAVFWDGDNTIKVKAVTSGEFILVESTYTDAQVSTALGSIANDMNTHIDKDTGEEHFFAGSIEIYGKIRNVLEAYSTNASIPDNGEVVLFCDYEPVSEGTDNITVLYPCYKPGNADLVNECHFGTMFGANNAKNRLFLSGNPNLPNHDWHSGDANDAYEADAKKLSGNYGYIEDLSECIYGETDNGIVGYSIVSNDKLLVLKGKSDKETTIYFRQPQLVTAINGSGTAMTGLDGNYLYQEEFSLVMGNNSVAGVSHKAVCNFNGDTVFISSDKQLVGLDLTGIIGDNQRYANSRSKYIDEDLRNQDLAGAFLWTNNKYLFIVLKNKIYAAHFELKGDTQYEWFVLDIANVSAVFEKDGVIHFGTNDGKMHRFCSEFRDSVKFFEGGNLYQNATSEMVTDATMLASIDPDKEYWFRVRKAHEGRLSYKVGSWSTTDSNNLDFLVTGTGSTVKVKLVSKTSGALDSEKRNWILLQIKEGKPIYFKDRSYSDNGLAGSAGLTTTGTPFYLKETDDADHSYTLHKEDGTAVNPTLLTSATVLMAVEEDVKMVNIDASTGKFKLQKDGETLDLENIGTSVAFSGEIIEYKPVDAYYVTKPFSMGGLEYLKTIWSFTITNDSNEPSDLEICLASNKIPNADLKSLGRISADKFGVDFSNFNFAKVDFDKNVVPRTYTSKRIVSGVKFACFAFRSTGDSNSVLSSMSVIYTLPFPSYGGD